MINEVYNVFSPSGSEGKMREYITERISGKFDEIKADKFGNLIARSGDCDFCIECGMDSSGIMIVSTDEKTAHFAGVGGINAEYLIGKKILFTDDKIGIVRYDGKISGESKFPELYLECDTKDRKVGDFGVVKSGYCETEDKIFANGLSNKIGLAAVLEALDKFDRIDDLCVLFSSQKRLDARGIQAFFGNEGFDRVVTVDGVLSENIKNCTFVVADSSGVCDEEFREELKNYIDCFAVTGEKLCISNISASGKGSSCTALGIPIYNKNKNFETVKKDDFNKAVELLKSVIKDLQN